MEFKDLLITIDTMYKVYKLTAIKQSDGETLVWIETDIGDLQYVEPRFNPTIIEPYIRQCFVQNGYTHFDFKLSTNFQLDIN